MQRFSTTRQHRAERRLRVEDARATEASESLKLVARLYRCAATWDCISRVRHKNRICRWCVKRAEAATEELPCGHPVAQWIPSFEVCAECQRAVLERRRSA